MLSFSVMMFSHDDVTSLGLSIGDLNKETALERSVTSQGKSKSVIFCHSVRYGSAISLNMSSVVAHLLQEPPAVGAPNEVCSALFAGKWRLSLAKIENAPSTEQSARSRVTTAAWR
jgi:hypothetical protein